MKLVTVIGARPQFIKAATISRVIKGRDDVEEIIVHTGQHFDQNMSDLFFSELDIPTPDYNLGIGECSHGAMTGQQLEAVETILMDEKPEWVLVYGDTNSTLAGALAAAKLNIPVAHVEAGLRSFNRKMPEEINRILTDHSARLLLAPTQIAVNNLLKEGVCEEWISNVGDVMYDAALYYWERASHRLALLDNLGVSTKNFILVTVHRAENTDNPHRIKRMISELIKLSKQIPVIFPVHPRTRIALKKNNLLVDAEKNLIVISPLGYLDMVLLEKHARTIITDSGGIQKEAYFHQTPCVILRDETEWVELLDNKFSCLYTLESGPLIDLIFMLESKAVDWNNQLYGDGNAAVRVLEKLMLT